MSGRQQRGENYLPKGKGVAQRAGLQLVDVHAPFMPLPFRAKDSRDACAVFYDHRTPFIETCIDKDGRCCATWRAGDCTRTGDGNDPLLDAGLHCGVNVWQRVQHFINAL